MHAHAFHMSLSLTTTGMLGSPESPGYLASKGKRDDAVAVATKLWGAKGVSQLGESAGGCRGQQGNGTIKCVRQHPTTAALAPQPTGRQAGIWNTGALVILLCADPDVLLSAPLNAVVPAGGKGAAAGGGESLFSATYRKGVLMGCLLFVFQQFSGINAIVYFSSSVFKQVRRERGAMCKRMCMCA